VGKEEEVRKLDATMIEGKKCIEMEEGRLMWKSKEMKVVESDVAHPVVKNQLWYNSNLDDRLWARGGMVARVVSGDSLLSLQQRVVDAGFVNVVVTPMRSDSVFLHCLGGDDICKVFNEVIQFFSMLFADLNKWSSVDVIYERDAWLRICGTLVHAWNELFFKLCVSGCGRFIRSDTCTVDRARFDYARVLISTTHLEVINSSSKIAIDGIKHVITLVEEWGCNLGEDVFLSEEELESPSDTLANIHDAVGMEDCQDDVDVLVDDLNKYWLQGNDEQVGNLKEEDCITLKESKVVFVQQVQQAEATLEQGPCTVNIVTSEENHVNLNSSFVVGSCSVKEGKKTSATSRSSSNPKQKKKKQAGVVLKHSAGFIKRIARLPSKGRKKNLKVLKKQERKRNVVSKETKEMSTSTSTSTNTSNVSVDKEWEHWFVLHDKK